MDELKLNYDQNIKFNNYIDYASFIDLEIKVDIVKTHLKKNKGHLVLHHIASVPTLPWLIEMAFETNLDASDSFGIPMTILFTARVQDNNLGCDIFICEINSLVFHVDEENGENKYKLENKNGRLADCTVETCALARIFDLLDFSTKQFLNLLGNGAVDVYLNDKQKNDYSLNEKRAHEMFAFAALEWFFNTDDFNINMFDIWDYLGRNTERLEKEVPTPAVEDFMNPPETAEKECPKSNY